MKSQAIKLVVALWAFAAAWAIAPADQAHAQATVVATCGTAPTPYAIGSTRPLTIDVNGNLCGLSSGGTIVLGSGLNVIGGVAVTPTATNPTATLTLPAATTAYTAGQMIANSATAASVVVPSFAIANTAGAAIIPRLRLYSNDTTSTAWGAQTIQVDLWTAAPTFSAGGDRATFNPATGTAGHIAAYSCTMSAEYGDGVFGECVPVYGNFSLPKLASGTSIFWTLIASSGSGVTGASKIFTLAAEVLN